MGLFHAGIFLVQAVVLSSFVICFLVLPTPSTYLKTHPDEFRGLNGTIGFTGVAGVAGVNGTNGANGADGRSLSINLRADLTNALINFTIANHTGNGFYMIAVIGDLRTNFSIPTGLAGSQNGSLIGYDGTTWSSFGTIAGVAGPTGPTGPAGATGPRGLSGTFTSMYAKVKSTTLSGSQATNVVSTVTWDSTAVFDSNGFFQPLADPTLLFVGISTAGLYQIGWSFNAASSGTGPEHSLVIIVTAGVNRCVGTHDLSSDGLANVHTGNCMQRLSSGDTVSMTYKVFTQTASTWTPGSSDDAPSMYIYKIA